MSIDFTFSQSYFHRISTRLVILGASRHFQNSLDQTLLAITIVFFVSLSSVLPIFRNTEASNNIDGYLEK